MPLETVSERSRQAPLTGRFRVGGLDFPLPGWSISCLAGILVIGAAVIGYDRYLQEPVQRIVGNPELEAQEREFQNHFGETPSSEEEIFDDERGRLQIIYYPSDGCLLVRRNQRDQWVRDSQEAAPPPAGPDEEVVAVTSAGFVPLQSGDGCPRKGACLDQHPGEFKSWKGGKSGCWIKVWRRWKDGCKHYQWFNECDGNWDREKNWACCVH